MPALTDRHPLDPHLDRITNDVRQLAEDLRWAHADAWWPTGGGLDKPKGASLHAPPTGTLADPDQVRGPKYAIGLGDDRSRQTLHDVIGRIAAVELRLAAAVLALGQRRTQPALVTPDGAARPAELLAAVTSCLWRAEALQADALLATPERRTAARSHLRHAAKDCDRSVRDLQQTLNRGAADGVAHREPNCRICGIRPRAERTASDGSSRPSKGGRCDTCAQWHQRNRGQERPRSLDEQDVGDARAAAGRRRERGEGWGAA